MGGRHRRPAAKGKKTAKPVSGRRRTGRFVKGGPPGPGRPKGSKSSFNARVKKEFSAALADMLEAPKYLAMVNRKLQAGKLPGPVWRFYLELHHGKPKQRLEHSIDESLYQLLSEIDPDDGRG